MTFAEALERGELLYQACTECQAAQAPARFACRRCGSARLEWRHAAGGGVVYAVTVVARAPSEEFRSLTPYTLVLVDLDEGARVMGHAEPGVRIGERVRAQFRRFSGRTLLNFVRNADA